MFEVQIVSSNNEFFAVLNEWEEFLARRAAKCSFWQDPHEIYSLVNGGDWDSMKIVLLRQDAKIVCIAPCIIRRQSFSFQFGVLRIPGPDVKILKILDSDFIFDREVAKSTCVEEILAVFREIKTEFDVIYLENIIDSSPTWNIFYNNASVAGLKLQRISTEMQLIRRQILASSYNNWLLSLKGKTRYNLKRQVRLLFDKFQEQIHFKRVSDARDVQGFLDALDDLFPKTWQAKTFTARKRNTPEDIDRLTSIARKGWLRSYLLSINNEPAAFILGYQYADVFEHSECGYDPKYSKSGVGSVLNFLMIKDLYEWNKPKVLNFGFGENKYKRILGNEEKNAYAAYLLFPGRWNLLIKLQKILIILGERVKSLSEKLGVERFLKNIFKRKI